MKQYFQGKRILVTGAGGFIGSNICRALIDEKASVTAVVRNKQHISNLEDIQKKISIKEADLTDKKALRSLIRSNDIIIHAAAVDGGTLFKKRHADRIFHDNVHMTMNILECLKKSSVQKFLFVSTAEVYVTVPDKSHVSEESFSLFSPQRPEQWYAFSKVIGEHTVNLIGDTLGIKVIIVRPANIYGQNDHVNKKRLVPILLDAIKKNKKKLLLSGSGNDIRSFLHIDDYVKNLLQIIEVSNGGIYNFAGTKPIRIKDFVKIFSDISGMKIAFKEKAKNKDEKNLRFILDISKTRKTISKWYDSSYKKRVKELLKVS